MTSSSSVSGRPRRPGGVTLHAVLIVISGLLGLIGSIAVIIGRSNDDVLRNTSVSSAPCYGSASWG